MNEIIKDLNDTICMAFLSSKSELSLKEGKENRIHNVLAIDKTDLAIEAIDYTIKYIKENCLKN